MRFVWDYNDKYLKENKKEKWGFLVRPYLSYLRIWDRLAADRPDYLIANSVYTKERIEKYYRKESQVIYPPVDIKSKIPASPALLAEAPARLDAKRAGRQNPKNEAMSYKLGEKNYFLIVSRLSAFKRIDVVIEAFNKLELPLLIVGEGGQKKYLMSRAKKNIQFLGWKTDDQLGEIYVNARAVLFPGIDDFGMVPVEAMLCGVPVIALERGGVRETVIPGKTGEFFGAATPEAVADGVGRFIENEKNYDKDLIKNRAGEFSKERFIKEMEDLINNITHNT
jgi:glycosyltransferase involved in cell wall biosynthesis